MFSIFMKSIFFFVGVGVAELLIEDLQAKGPGEPSNHKAVSANTIFDAMYYLRQLTDRVAGAPIRLDLNNENLKCNKNTMFKFTIFDNQKSLSSTYF